MSKCKKPKKTIRKTTARAPGTVPAMVVPDGFRLLTTGERICKGDIYCRGAGHSWHECRTIGGKWNAKGCWPMARRHNKEISNNGSAPIQNGGAK